MRDEVGQRASYTEYLFAPRGTLRRGYSQDLLNNLFRHPYTKIEFLEQDLDVSRPTAARYLGELEKSGLVRKMKLGRTNFHINEPLVAILGG